MSGESVTGGVHNCTSCGRSVPAGSQFCASCGHPVHAAESGSGPTHPPEATNTPEDRHTPSAPGPPAAPPPPTETGGDESLWRRFRSQRVWVQVVAWLFVSPIVLLLWIWSGTRWPAAGKIAATLVIVGVSIAAAASGGGGGGSNKSATPPASSTPSTTTPSTAASSEPSSSPPPPSTDTGRMSQGEFDSLTTPMQDLASEESDFGTQISSKCRVLMTALELADASTCIHDAWSGTYDKGLAVYSTIDDLKGDVGDGCKTTLLAYQDALDRFISTQDRAAKAGENLQFARFTALAKGTVRLSKRYTRLQTKVLLECAPS